MKLRSVVLRHEKRWVHDVGGELRLLPKGTTIASILQSSDPLAVAASFTGEKVCAAELADAAPPLEDQEVWAAGVTYQSSKMARLTESGQSTCYEKVYAASRPQVFPKGRGRDVITSGKPLTLRPDSSWTVPEPELVLVLSAVGRIVGVTAGNDLSCRDVEGENPLYQPQAKIWAGSCALAPVVVLTNDLDWIRTRDIRMTIVRGGQTIFAGATNTAQIVRPLEQLAQTLFAYRNFPDGAFLFTGTGVVPPDDFTLRDGDNVEIEIEGVGSVKNVCSNAVPGRLITSIRSNL